MEPANWTKESTASEAGERNACDVRARPADLDEVATRRQNFRKEALTEAGDSSL